MHYRTRQGGDCRKWKEMYTEYKLLTLVEGDVTINTRVQAGGR